MYEPTFWQDHVTEYDNRFREQNNADGTITHVPIEGEIIQEGTPQNAANFNNMEMGIFAESEIAAELTRVALQNAAKITGAIGNLSEHNHDDRYYTETEIDSKLSGKADASHTHAASEISDLPVSIAASIADHNTNINAHGSILGDISRLEGEVETLKLSYGTNITANAFSVTFETIDELSVAGVYNTERGTVDF